MNHLYEVLRLVATRIGGHISAYVIAGTSTGYKHGIYDVDRVIIAIVFSADINAAIGVEVFAWQFDFDVADNHRCRRVNNVNCLSEVARIIAFICYGPCAIDYLMARISGRVINIDVR